MMELPSDRPLILVVEDDPDVGRIVTLVLQTEGYSILLADNAMAALAVISDYPPTLIVSDVMMPGLSGLELLSVLKEKQETADIPVLIMSARVAAPDIQAGHQAGALGYLKKPFTAIELLTAVRETFAKAAALRSPADGEAA